MYWNYAQSNPKASSFPLMIRTHGDPTNVATAVRAAIRAVDPTAAVSDIAPMPDVIEQSLGKPRFYLMMLEAFAAVAIVLTVAGLYGVLSYAVSQRTRELGIRAALGSSRRQLVSLVAFDGGSLVLLGIIIGFAAGAGLTRLAVSMLYGTSPLDPETWILAALTLLVATALATVIPALRASRADPIIAMRAE